MIVAESSLKKIKWSSACTKDELVTTVLTWAVSNLLEEGMLVAER